MLRFATAAVLIASVVAGCAGETQSSPLIEGRDLYANSCSVCHGSTGDGGTAPTLRNVHETFPSCSTHMEWVSLGSENWKQVHGDTYGADNKPIDSVMPAHAERLTAEQIALVAAFERIQYAEMEKAAVFDDCGIDQDTPATP